MEKKGGCCLAPRYGAAAGGQQAGAAWQMGRIMLKFRPIAPKPAAMAPVPTPAPVAAAAGRGKRKAAGGGGGRRGRKPKKAATVAAVAAAPAPAAVQAVGDCSRKDKVCEKEKSLSSRSSSSSGMTSVDSSPPPPAQQQQTTLPLMPVSPVEEKAAPVASVAVASPPAGPQPAAPPLALRHPAAAASWLTVEEVTATWRDGEAPACVGPGADDDAPAFVSDQWGRVTWSNAAFSQAVSADDDAVDTAPLVALAGALPAWGTCAGFTCRVRVVRHAGAAPRRACSFSVVAPCDVWRLDAGGCYLWRLDLQAALTLGGLP